MGGPRAQSIQRMGSKLGELWVDEWGRWGGRRAIRGRAPAGERKAGSSKREGRGAEPRGRGFSYVEGKQLHRGVQCARDQGLGGAAGLCRRLLSSIQDAQTQGDGQTWGTREGGWEQWTGGHTARCGGRVQRGLAAQPGRSAPAQRSVLSGLLSTSSKDPRPSHPGRALPTGGNQPAGADGGSGEGAARLRALGVCGRASTQSAAGREGTRAGRGRRLVSVVWAQVLDTQAGDTALLAIRLQSQWQGRTGTQG